MSLRLGTSANELALRVNVTFKVKRLSLSSMSVPID